MEQIYQLKTYCNLNLFEQAGLTAEDRAWWLQREEKERKDKQEAESKHASSIPRPRIPRR